MPLEKRHQEWMKSAPKGAVLLCDSGGTLMMGPGNLSNVPILCDLLRYLPPLGWEHINLTDDAFGAEAMV